MPKSILSFYSPTIYSKLLAWHGHTVHSVGDLFRIDGHDQFNHMIDLNSVWSAYPAYHPVDRTFQVKSPIRWHYSRPWQIPTQQSTLADALAARVKTIEQLDQRINIFWSGGIDSTTLITAFLQNLNNLNQLRILYTPFSTYDHPEFIPYLQKNFNLELVDLSGMVYMNTQFDGVFVSGDGGDELMASVDLSFFEKYGPEVLTQSWPDFFRREGHSQQLIDFCQQHFVSAGRPIETVLEARWWFYTCFKNSSCLWLKFHYFSDYENFNYNRFISFFEKEKFESYIYYNTDQIITGTDYATWKQPFKDYCHQHNRLDAWYKTARKTHNNQLSRYIGKKTVLKDSRWLVQLKDGDNLSSLSLPSLPFVSRQEYNEQLYSIMDPLFYDAI